MRSKKLMQRLAVTVLSASLLVGNLSLGGVTKANAKETTTVTNTNKKETKTGSITVNGNDIKADNVNGLTFKGFGILSGNGSSDLLMDYKSQNPEEYAKLMQYLFGGEHPLMTHVKLEMGNDLNNSTAAEPCTKRFQDEAANVARDPGFQLAADAKKINPDVKVSILRWKTPAWAVDEEDEQIYQWYKETVLAAYEKYGYMVDYINPNTNESWSTKYDVPSTKHFAQMVAAETSDTIPDATELALYKKIKFVVSDASGVVHDDVAATMKTDTDFYNAVSAVGYHYSPQDDTNGGMKWLADVADKEVWNSEAQATFSNSAFRPSNTFANSDSTGSGIGGPGSALEMANTFVKGFVLSRRTHVIYQPAIASFYEGEQYSFKELVSARDPWSGWIHYDAGLLMLAHVSKFAKTGWENDTNTAGIWRAVPSASKSTAEGDNPVNGRNGGENYMTVASPAKDNFSTVIVNDSEYPMTYTVKTENMKLAADQKLNVWETRAADDGAFNENYMKNTGAVSANADGTYTVSVQPFSIATVTTVEKTASEIDEMKLPVEGERTVLDTDATGDKQNTEDKYLYADNFDYTGKTVPVLDGKGGLSDDTEDYIASRGGDAGAMIRYANITNGAFEALKNNAGEYVMRQQLDQNINGLGGSWNRSNPEAVIGDFRWTNYAASVNTCFVDDQADQFSQISIRHTSGSHNVLVAAGYTFRVYPEGKWELYRRQDVVASGDFASDDMGTGFRAGSCVWNNLKLQGAGDVITAYVNNKLVTTFTDPKPVTSGRIAVGSAFTYTDFANLKVTKIDGYTPYYTELMDDMETYDLTEEKNARLVYNDKWTHENGKGMFVYQRSQSASTGAGATLTYKFKGTGLEVLSNAKTKASVEISVDGNVVDDSATTIPAEYMSMTCAARGLEYGEHTVTFKVLSGTMYVDVVGVLGPKYDGSGDTEDELTFPKNPTKPVYTPKPTDTPASPTPTPETPVVSPTPAPAPTAAPVVKKGTVVKVGTNKYTVTNVTKKTVEYKVPAKKTVTKVSIPTSIKITVNGIKKSFKVTAVGKSAFKSCKKLSALSIGGKLTKVAKGAFSGCKKTIKVSGKYKKVNVKLLKKSGYKKFKVA